MTDTLTSQLITIDDITISYYTNITRKYHYISNITGNDIIYCLGNFLCIKYPDYDETVNVDWNIIKDYYVNIIKKKTMPDYKNIKSWDELIQSNIDFMKGKYYRTFYNVGPIDYETVKNKKYYNNILKLNELGIFTYFSQPALYYECEDDIINLKLDYIYFVCETHIGEKIISKLINNDDIYIMYNTIDKAFSNLPLDKIIASNELIDNGEIKYQGEISNDRHSERSLLNVAHRYPHLQEINNEGYGFLIFGKDIKKPVSVSQLIIDAIV